MPRSLTVLAVDDDALVLFNTTAMLEDLGHTAIEAHSGKEALGDPAPPENRPGGRPTRPMPQMTGAQLAETIRAEWPDLPIDPGHRLCRAAWAAAGQGLPKLFRSRSTNGP